MQDLASTSSGLMVPLPLGSQYFAWFPANGAYVSSQSWGSNPTNVGYTSDSVEIDAFVWNNPAFLPVFAAGNSGEAGLIGHYLLLGPEASSKNSLVVGATNTELDAMLLFPTFCAQHGITPSSDPVINSPAYLTGFSSTGPTKDRRIKPDVVAPGLLTIVAREDQARPNTPSATCSFAASSIGVSGTSFSSPLVAGYAVNIRQWLMSGGYMGIPFAQPSAALIKNIIISTAQALKGISYLEAGTTSAATLNSDPVFAPYGTQWVWGFGRPLLDPMISSTPTKYLIDTYSVAEMTVQNISVPAFTATSQETAFCVESGALGSNVLSITLVYSDFPGTVPTTSTNAKLPRLINDLDIWSVDNTGAVIFPNGQASPDRKNNVERVQIPLSSPINTFRVLMVRAALIQVSPQNYALSIANENTQAGSFLNVTQMQLSLTNTSTGMDPSHPCSVIYSTHKSVFDSLRSSSPPPSPSPPPGTSTSSAQLASAFLCVACALLCVS
jgi:hypothetical protein